MQCTLARWRPARLETVVELPRVIGPVILFEPVVIFGVHRVRGPKGVETTTKAFREHERPVRSEERTTINCVVVGGVPEDVVNGRSNIDVGYDFRVDQTCGDTARPPNEEGNLDRVVVDVPLPVQLMLVPLV